MLLNSLVSRALATHDIRHLRSFNLLGGYFTCPHARLGQCVLVKDLYTRRIVLSGLSFLV